MLAALALLGLNAIADPSVDGATPEPAAPQAPAVVPMPLPLEDGGSLPLARPQTPEEALYGKVDDEGGRVEGKQRRRRDGDYVVWELESGTVVRYRHVSGRRTVDDHLFDAAGFPLATLRYDDGGALASAVVHAVPPVEVPLAGWIAREVPGGKLALPDVPGERPGGGTRIAVLGGELDIWQEANADDPFSDGFRDGLVAGCGCFVVDRATTWVDGQPAVRYRLLVPGAWPRDAVDLWAVPRKAQGQTGQGQTGQGQTGQGQTGQGQTGLWLMAFRVTSPADPVSALLPGRVFVGLMEFGPPAAGGAP
jgi:hypothetical protein